MAAPRQSSNAAGQGEGGGLSEFAEFGVLHVMVLSAKHLPKV